MYFKKLQECSVQVFVVVWFSFVQIHGKLFGKINSLPGNYFGNVNKVYNMHRQLFILVFRTKMNNKRF